MDSSYKITNVFSRIIKRGDPAFFEGTVFTKLGMVFVYSQGGLRPWTILQFVKDSRVFERQIKKSYTEKGLSIIAHRFIKDTPHDTK